MPRKQNGFGSTGSFGMKGVNSKVDKGKPIGAAGSYPSDRRYGSTVHRTVIEKYDVDSDWTRWRKGLEYFYRGAFLDFDDIETILYQGSVDEVRVLFDGFEFATRNSDSASHFTAKRSMLETKDLGTIVDKFVDKEEYAYNWLRHEIWVEVLQQEKTVSSKLRRLVGERITDGTTSANVVNVLAADQTPAVYFGKNTKEEQCTVRVSVPLAEIQASQYVQDNNGDLNCLIGEVGYYKQFLVERAVGAGDTFADEDDFFTVSVDDDNTGFEFQILDNTTNLPPALLDINGLSQLFSTTNATTNLQGKFLYRKSDYQRFFGNQYLTGQVVEGKVSELSYALMPFEIRSVVVIGNQLEILSVPFQASLLLFTPGELSNFLVLADNSFTRTVDDFDADGNYLHAEPGPNEQLWKRLETDVDPWYDPIFDSGQPLDYSDVFCCSCPDYSHAIIRMPEAGANRQQRFPLPSAMSENTYNQLGLREAAGVVQSWETLRHRTSFKMCKHTVATMFHHKIKVQEPKQYPSFDSRVKFEEKLNRDMDQVAEEFRSQLKRSEITTKEVVYLLAQGLNLDEIETAYVMLNSRY